MLEEGVVVHLDFVIEDTLPKRTQAKRLIVGNKVDFMAPSCQSQPQLSGYGTGSAVGGITGDSDLHGLVAIGRIGARDNKAGTL
jgi:hypothetical protein